MTSLTEYYNLASAPYQQVTQAWQQAQEQRKQRDLQGLAALYYSGGADPKELTAEVARRGGDPSFILQDQDRQQKAAEQKLQRMASLLVSAPESMRQQMWQKIRPEAERLGVGPLPDVLDEPFMPVVRNIAAGGKLGDDRASYLNLGQGTVLNQATGQFMKVPGWQEESKEAWGYVPDPRNPNNEIYARRVGTDFFDMAGNPIIGGAPQGPASAPQGPAGVLAPIEEMAKVAESMGAHVGSRQRTQSEQDALMARGRTKVKNSFHLYNMAGDFTFQDPAAKARFAEFARSKKYQVVDEGDHLHIEPYGSPPSGGGAGSTGGIVGVRPRHKPEAGKEGGGPDVKGERDLRREYTDLIKTPQIVVDSYNKLKVASANPSAAGDLSMIFAYMKMLDPNSVVREQEFANAQNAAGVPDQVRNMYNRALNGQRLNPNQRADFLAQAEKLATQQQEVVTYYENYYRDLAAEYGYDPKRVTFNARPPDAPKGRPPQSQPASSQPQGGRFASMSNEDLLKALNSPQ